LTDVKFFLESPLGQVLKVMEGERPEDVPKFLWRSGDAFLPEKVKKVLDAYLMGSDNSLAYINGWSLVHFGTGAVLAKLFPEWSVLKAFILHCFWEIWQIAIKMTPPTQRGVIDTLVDTLMFMLGFVLVKGSREKIKNK